MKLAMVKTQARLKREKLQSRMILTVHDELVFEAPEAELEKAKAIVREEMEGTFPMRVPVEGGLGCGTELEGGEVGTRCQVGAAFDRLS